ncbi:hypothetical protein Csa_005450 [Cucumis sativus]|uniref:Uncharacterized protein n=1 Tax=Cucumis sativus TaxID=3659 RepID=A0A0A0KA72_CUCSA|nr:hypothetical protein Csa_005450 [Cucumis sativus]
MYAAGEVIVAERQKIGASVCCNLKSKGGGCTATCVKGWGFTAGGVVIGKERPPVRKVRM